MGVFVVGVVRLVLDRRRRLWVGHDNEGIGEWIVYEGFRGRDRGVALKKKKPIQNKFEEEESWGFWFEILSRTAKFLPLQL